MGILIYLHVPSLSAGQKPKNDRKLGRTSWRACGPQGCFRCTCTHKIHQETLCMSLYGTDIIFCLFMEIFGGQGCERGVCGKQCIRPLPITGGSTKMVQIMIWRFIHKNIKLCPLDPENGRLRESKHHLPKAPFSHPRKDLCRRVDNNDPHLVSYYIIWMCCMFSMSLLSVFSITRWKIDQTRSSSGGFQECFGGCTVCSGSFSFSIHLHPSYHGPMNHRAQNLIQFCSMIGEKGEEQIGRKLGGLERQAALQAVLKKSAI